MVKAPALHSPDQQQPYQPLIPDKLKLNCNRLQMAAEIKSPQTINNTATQQPIEPTPSPPPSPTSLPPAVVVPTTTTPATSCPVVAPTPTLTKPTPPPPAPPQQQPQVQTPLVAASSVQSVPIAPVANLGHTTTTVTQTAIAVVAPTARGNHNINNNNNTIINQQQMASNLKHMSVAMNVNGPPHNHSHPPRIPHHFHHLPPFPVPPPGGGNPWPIVEPVFHFGPGFEPQTRPYCPTHSQGQHPSEHVVLFHVNPGVSVTFQVAGNREVVRGKSEFFFLFVIVLNG